MLNIAVTGITGKSGQFFLKNLISNSKDMSDFSFRILARSESNSENGKIGRELLKIAQTKSELNFSITEGDILDIELIKDWLDKDKNTTDILLHISGIEYSKNLVSLALANNVKHLILVHTTGIYSKYKSAGEEYRHIEDDIKQMVADFKKDRSDLSLTILRPTMIYGDLEDHNISVFIRMVDKLRLFPVINGAYYDLQPVWCKDLGDAYFQIVKNHDKVEDKEYILSGGESIQLRDIFIEIERQLGVKNYYFSIPFWLANFGSWFVFFLSFGKFDLREKVKRMVESRAFSHQKAFEDFNYRPACFEEGVKDEINMYLKSKVK